MRTLKSLLRPPRMTTWLVVWLVLAAAAFSFSPHLVGVSLYKAHLMALGGWAGYWIDRGLFPYARPGDMGASQLFEEASALPPIDLPQAILAAAAFIRRALIVMGCLIAVSVGA